MKAKKFSKKLNLKKRTVVNLNDGEMKNAHGGSGAYTICPKCIFPVSPVTFCGTCNSLCTGYYCCHPVD